MSVERNPITAQTPVARVATVSSGITRVPEVEITRKITIGRTSELQVRIVLSYLPFTRVFEIFAVIERCYDYYFQKSCKFNIQMPNK